MVRSMASVLTDQAADLAVTMRQWQSETSTNTSKTCAEDYIRAIEEQIELATDMTGLSTSTRFKLDSVGTELWNACRAQVMGAVSDDKEAMELSNRGTAISSRNYAEYESDLYLDSRGRGCCATRFCVAARCSR